MPAVDAAAIRPGALRRVLVRLPNWLGDTVMALPALRALRAALPAAELRCAGPWAVPLLAAEPGLARAEPTPARAGARLRQALGWRRLGLDLVLVLPGSFETALAARLSGARWRIGYRGEGRGALLSHALPPRPGTPHQAVAYLELLRPIVGVESLPAPSPSLGVLPEHRAEARALLAAVGVAPGDRAVGLQLGAAFGSSKLWPPERLAALAHRLEGRGIRAVFLGSPDSGGLLRAAAAASPRPLRSLVGRDRPALLPALVAELDALVSADSGPAHVAAAAGRPTVTLFGPTDPRLTAPLGPRQRVIWRRPPCAPCFLARCPIDHRCLAEVDVASVETEVLAALNGGP